MSQNINMHHDVLHACCELLGDSRTSCLCANNPALNTCVWLVHIIGLTTEFQIRIVTEISAFVLLCATIDLLSMKNGLSMVLNANFSVHRVSICFSRPQPVRRRMWRPAELWLQTRACTANTSSSMNVCLGRTQHNCVISTTHVVLRLFSSFAQFSSSIRTSTITQRTSPWEIPHELSKTQQITCNSMQFRHRRHVAAARLVCLDLHGGEHHLHMTAVYSGICRAPMPV